MTSVEAGWQPANDTEAALARAMLADDRREFFRIVATAPLYLPQAEPDADADADTGQTFFTADLVGQTVLPVFISVEGLSAFAGAYPVTTYAELREKWPRPQWWLAVNPGFPIDAYLPIDAVAAAARGDVAVATIGEALVDAMAEDPQGAALLDTDEQLRAAAERGDGTAYVETLLAATVVVPTSREVADPGEILGDAPPWLVTGTPEAPLIEVCTSAETFGQAFPVPPPHLVLPLPLLLAVWPEGHAMAVNPRSPLAIELSGDDVLARLLSAVPEPEHDNGTEEPP